MIAAAVASVLLAVALWVWPEPRWTLYRVTDPPPGRDRSPRWLGAGPARTDPFAIASAFDLFAVCLRAGLPVGVAASVVAGRAPGPLAGPLRRVAELLQLGADPDAAWSALLDDSAGDKDASVGDHLDALAALARRSARAGSSLAGGLAELAEDVRRRAHDDALAAAERAGVAISGPLGLCFLPAFICLGIVPVVVGLASTVLGSF